MTDVLGLTDARTVMAKLLTDNLGDDIGVFDAIPDSIAPPCVYVTWSNPMLVQTTWCEFTSIIQLIVVAQRIEPGGQYAILEQMVGDIVTILKTNRYGIRDVTAPFPLVLGGVNYLAVSFNIPMEVGD